MTPAASSAHSPAAPALAGFWNLDDATREDLLLRGIAAAHAYHFERNTAYRNTVAAHGVGPRVPPAEMPRLLRATSQAFKSYTDVLGTPFPQDRPAEFFRWLTEHVSVDLHAGAPRPRSRYRTLEGLLKAVERSRPDIGLEMLTSSGTSGRMTVIPRDRGSADLAAESFSLSFQRYLGVTADFTAIFMAPKRARVGVPRIARSGLLATGLAPDKLHFTVPISRPLKTSLLRRLVDAQAVESAISRLIPAGAREERVLLFGSLVQLHNIASFLLDARRTATLAPGSLLATWGGVKGQSAGTPAKMRQDLRDAFKLTTGEPAPVRDLYGMAEAGWAAMQCSHGNYHVPPWIYAVTLDDQDAFQKGPRSTGLLAFFDPYGGGDLFPAFFRTADRVTLVQGPACPCGEGGSFLEESSVQRLGLPCATGNAPRL